MSFPASLCGQGISYTFWIMLPVKIFQWLPIAYGMNSKCLCMAFKVLQCLMPNCRTPTLPSAFLVMESVLHACTPCTCSALPSHWKFPVSSLLTFAHAVSLPCLPFFHSPSGEFLVLKDFWCVAPFKVPALTPLGQTPPRHDPQSFLAPGASFVDDNFSMDLMGRVGDGFRMIQAR